MISKILRIDDVGASSKMFNQHGKKMLYFKGVPIFYWPLANFWFFKRVKPFRRWGIYDELTASEWVIFLKIFNDHKIKPVIAVTAAWVDKESNLIPFPEKFPEEAAVLKQALLDDKIIIANHGLTHCVLGSHLPKLFKSNRQYHREFWPDLDQSIHEEHVLKSQFILEKYFGREINIFVPPGNIWGYKTYLALKKTNIKQVMSKQYMMDSMEEMDGIKYFNDSQSINIHDRDLKLFGEKWLLELIKKIYVK